jgi:hypothetical protein
MATSEDEPQDDDAPAPRPHGGFENRVEHATDWLNSKLRPYIGGAQLGPYGPDDEAPVADRPCPICGHPMGEHPAEVGDDGRVYLHHPDERYPDVLDTGIQE